MRRCSAEPGGRQLTWKMRVSLAAAAAASFLLLGLFTSIGDSLSLEEDWEGSGLDLEFSGSGDEWEENRTDDINSRTLTEGRNHNSHASSDRNVFKMPVNESELVILGSSKSFLQNSAMLEGIIVGGVTGLILAVAATALLIYRYHMKDENNILGKFSVV